MPSLFQSFGTPEAVRRVWSPLSFGGAGALLALTTLATLGVPTETTLLASLAAFFGFLPLGFALIARRSPRNDLSVAVTVFVSAAAWGLLWAAVRASGASGLVCYAATAMLWLLGVPIVARVIGALATRLGDRTGRDDTLAKERDRLRALTEERQARFRDVLLSPALADAIHQRDADALRTVLASGARVNARGDHGATPLMLAAKAWWVEGVEILMRAGADPEALDDTRIDAERHAVYDRERVHDPEALAIVGLLHYASGD